MTKPINERLRALCNSFAGNYDIRVLAGEAADEIERLRSTTQPEARFSPVLERASTKQHGWVAVMEQDPRGQWTFARLPDEPPAKQP